MRRIDSPNRAVDLFGAGKDGFKAAIAGVTPATELTPAWFNAVQEAIVRTIEAAGYALSASDYDQFTNAVQQLIATRVSSLVNSAPATLDTLKELADALGDDPNFAATIAAQLATTTAQLATKESFASGTRMLFQQSTAPTGWTKVTTYDNSALRVVSGAAGSGGTVGFNAAFVNGNVGNTALTIAQIPSHDHGTPVTARDGSTAALGDGGGTSTYPGVRSGATGGGLPHTHTLNLDVQYVDVIIASKN
jgi:hypothetical protein